MSNASIRLLGDVSVTRRDGVTTVLRRHQPRTVAALFVLERHRSVARTEIADVLWADRLPDHWAGAVRGVVSKVRSFFDELDVGEVLVSTADGWRLELPDGVEIDVERSRSAVERAEATRRAGDDGQADATGDPSDGGASFDELVEAARQLAAELAPGAECAWLDEQRDTLRRDRRRCLTALVHAAAVVARPDVAVSAARTLVREDPYSDAAVRMLMQALLAAGDRPGAIATHEEFDRRLHEDLGVRPEAATEDLARSARGLGVPAPSVPDVARRAGARLVGRDHELSELQRCWAEVVAGDGPRAVLITGEPGAGKTRLAAEAAGLVDRGHLLWGRCSPERRVSFEPVVEALARVLSADPSPLEALGPLAGELVPLLPELAVHDVVDGPAGRPTGRASAAPSIVVRDESERSQLFRALTAVVRAIVGAPSVWVVDDVQWANEDTLALLEHALGALGDLRVLVVLTSRGHDRDVAAMLSTAARSLPLTTIGLDGLDVAAVTDLLSTEGVIDADEVGELVRTRTGGNPFFIRELVRSADGAGRLDPQSLPATLRSWIDQRVAALDPSTADVLGAAAVLGATVDVDVLAAVVGSPVRDVLSRCRTLVAEGFLGEREGEADLAFVHALTRDAVDDGLAAVERRHLHLCAADALIDLRPDGAVALVAAHLAQAGPAVDVRAVEAMSAAGDEALGQTAWASALDWFTEVLGRRPEPTPDRVHARIGAGAALRGLGRRDEARDSLSDALETARALGAPRLVAEATLGLVGGGARGVSESLADEERAQLLRAAIEGLGPDDDDLIVPAQLELALALLLTDLDEERRALAADALDRARRLGRDDLLGSALLGSRVARHGPEHAESRLAEVDEVLAIDPRRRSHAVTVGALMARHEDALVVGDRALARAALAEAHAAVEQSGHPYWRWVVQTWTALDLVIDGSLDEAELAAFAALELQADHPESMACLGVNLVDVRLFQGRSAEVVDLLAAAADDNPQIPAYRAVLALCLAECGQLEAAGSQYRHFASTSFASVPDDTNRLLTLAVLADVAATLADEAGARELIELLRPHGARQVVLNCFAGGGAFWGPVATQLGRLSETIGDAGEASRWYDVARREASSFGSPLALARIPTR